MCYIGEYYLVGNVILSTNEVYFLMCNIFFQVVLNSVVYAMVLSSSQYFTHLEKRCLASETALF